jgi:hypothetical protein
MTKLGTFVRGPITLVLDYFECFVVDGVNVLVFEHVWNRSCIAMVKRRTCGYDMRTRQM